MDRRLCVTFSVVTYAYASKNESGLPPRLPRVKGPWIRPSILRPTHKNSITDADRAK